MVNPVYNALCCITAITQHGMHILWWENTIGEQVIVPDNFVWRCQRVEIKACIHETCYVNIMIWRDVQG